jgi:uncharacterized iron-regulated membrane protein
MIRVRWPLFIRKTHKWLSLVLGIQVVLWTLTGFYMVVVHIDHIRGDHLVRPAMATPFRTDQMVPPAGIVADHPEAREVRLQRLFGDPVWRVEAGASTFLIDAESGTRLPDLTEEQVRARALEIYTGSEPIAAVRLLSEAPMELKSRTPPFWQVEFEKWNRPVLYISPTTGELISKRHMLWRVFDFAWMLHIMDYENRTDVNNPLLRIATWSAVLLALSGAWLLFWSFPRKKRRKT